MPSVGVFAAIFDEQRRIAVRQDELWPAKLDYARR
jgi:hypothetical protein